MTSTDNRPAIIDYNGRHPYAGLLHNITPGADVVQAMSEADLLYSVEKIPLYGVLQTADWIKAHPYQAQPNHSLLHVADRALTVRFDSTYTPLAVVGNDYTVIQNLDAFQPLDVLREQGRITFDQGGRTRDGRHAFLLCRLTDGHTLPGGDPHDRFIRAITSHDGTGALRLIPVSQRAFCCNQMPAILASRGAVVSIRHGRKAAERMEALPDMLDMLVSKLDEFDFEWARLANQRASHWDVDDFILRLFPMPQGHDVTARMRENVQVRRDTVARIIDGPTNQNIAGSKAALVAAATEWNQWFRTKDARRSALRTLEGTDTAFAHRAWDLVGAL